MNSQPIGFFDSGVGGTTIWREVVKILPNENTIYLADSKNAPYGDKSKEDIIALCDKNTKYLLDVGAKIIVVACNTATTNAISYLRNQYKIPFIGIEPAIKPAALKSKSKSIGILATKGTLSSELFHKKSNIYVKENHIHIVEQEGTGLVELIENGLIESQKMRGLLNRYLTYLTSFHIDYLVLGCTHYPYLKPLIKEIIKNNIKILDSGIPVAKQVKRILEKEQLLNSSTFCSSHKWFTNKDKSILETFMPNRIKVNVEYLDF